MGRRSRLISKYYRLLRKMNSVSSMNSDFSNKLSKASLVMNDSIVVDNVTFQSNEIQGLIREVENIQNILCFSIIPSIEEDIRELEEDDD